MFYSMRIITTFQPLDTTKTPEFMQFRESGVHQAVLKAYRCMRCGVFEEIIAARVSSMQIKIDETEF